MPPNTSPRITPDRTRTSPSHDVPSIGPILCIPSLAFPTPQARIIDTHQVRRPGYRLLSAHVDRCRRTIYPHKTGKRITRYKNGKSVLWGMVWKHGMGRTPPDGYLGIFRIASSRIDLACHRNQGLHILLRIFMRTLDLMNIAPAWTCTWLGRGLD